MDRNQIIGLLLISVLILVYLQFFAPEEPIKNNNPATTESVTPEEAQKPSVPSASIDTVWTDSAVFEKYGKEYGVLAKNTVGEAKEVVLENKDIKIIFSTKGGSIKSILLKDYLTFDKKSLYLVDKESNKMSFKLPTKNGAVDLNNLYFTTQSQNQVVYEKDSASVSFRLEAEPGKYIERTYTLPGEGFQILSSIQTSGLENLIENKNIQFSWINDVKKVEKDLATTRISTTVNYYTAEGDFKNISESSLDPETESFNTPVKWVSMKQRFFTSAIIMEEPFNAGEVKSSVNEADTNLVKHLEAHLTLPGSVLKDGKIDFKYYFGPNNYQITKKVTEGFGNNVYLGWAIFSTINKYLVIPIFNFLQNYIGNYGIIILILVFIIKLILFPLSYKSHISLAKTKVLKPELDEIKAKHGNDMQKVQAEQMQLYSKVGVNPLSGCIPVLLQMPIFLALYNFFPNSIELRQESFLWAADLSTYDSIATLPFSIPGGYGNHVSLFCILMTISTLVYTWFNNQVSTITGPMKSMQYVMPVIFLFFFNSLAAGLTYYYFVNNLLTIGQQLGFRLFVDEKKIRQKLDENKVKNKDKKKSKFQQRLEDAMKQAETAKKAPAKRKK
ncbi:MAG TPA: membrane protein insertase YidC [Cytophagales bacterium]|nr:membrane protein insertase YidC [Cytophagales bacterium]